MVNENINKYFSGGHIFYFPNYKMSDNPIITNDFLIFIKYLLGNANLSDKTISSYTDDESMTEFRKAFTHKSYSPFFNYEYLEFRGDVIVNFAITKYLRNRFPKIVSVTWLTKLKHNLASKKVLSSVAGQNDFEKFILYGDKILYTKKGEIDNSDYLSILEDTFESFCGATVLVSRKKNSVGVGFAIIYQIISKLYNRQTINLKYGEVFDYISRVKLLYDANGWDFKKDKQTIYSWRNGVFVTSLYGYSPDEKDKKILISKKSGKTKDESVEEASKYALEVLKKKYNIIEKIPPIYEECSEKCEEEIKPAPSIPKGFKEFIVDLLHKAMVKDSAIEIFTREEYLMEFRISFIHNSYSSVGNYNLYKFEGVTVVDLAIVDYLGYRFPDIISEKWLTTIKQNIVGKSKDVAEKNKLLKIAEENDFERFILFGKEIEENLEKYPDKKKNTKYQKMIENVFKAFFGSLVSVIDEIKGNGVGYAVAFKLFSYYMNSEKISIDYKDVFNPKGRLKELYDKYRWPFEKSIQHSYDENTGLHTITIVGYPLNKKIYHENNKVVLAKISGRIKSETSQKASSIALEKLDKLYHITEIPPDPYEN